MLTELETIIEYILSKTHLSGLIFILSLLSLKSTGQEYAIGADLSFLKSAEDRGFGFKENNEVKPGLKIFREHGLYTAFNTLIMNPLGCCFLFRIRASCLSISPPIPPKGGLFLCTNLNPPLGGQGGG
jgi:hypothetical protein